MRSSEGMKEKLPIKNDEERGMDYFMIRFGVLNKEKALLLSQQGFFFVAEEGFEPPTFGL